MVVAMIFCIVILIAIAAAHLYGVFFLKPPNPDTVSARVQLATPPVLFAALVWTIAAIAAVLAILITTMKKRRSDMRYDVSVIGLYILDVLGRPVTHIPDRGNVEFIEEIRLTVAGTAGGTVVDTAKLGLKSLAVGAVGDDEKADWVLMTMQKHGIDTTAMQRLKGMPTSATILNVRPNGDRPACMCAALPIISTFHPQHVRSGLRCADHSPGRHRPAEEARWRRPSVTLLKEAKKRGRTVTFDLIAASADTIAIVGPLLPYIDYFMPSIEEARDMSGQVNGGRLRHVLSRQGGHLLRLHARRRGRLLCPLGWHATEVARL